MILDKSCYVRIVVVVVAVPTEIAVIAYVAASCQCRSVYVVLLVGPMMVAEGPVAVTEVVTVAFVSDASALSALGE